jgi:hypothetical protein
MADPIPKYLQKNVALLYKQFKNGDFTFQDAMITLNKDVRYTGQILSHLGKARWISNRNDKLDQRKKIYHINKFDEIISSFEKD